MFALLQVRIIRNHCVILILHSDFPYSYTFSCVGALQTTLPAPRRPRNNSVVTRSFGRQAVCGRALRMTSFSLKGADAPFTPASQVRTQLFDYFLCTLTYRFLEEWFISNLKSAENSISLPICLLTNTLLYGTISLIKMER